MRYAVEVAVRWSDMDAYGHVNHARTVTLLEDARTDLLFREMPRRGHGGFDDAIVVSKLSVNYLAPIVFGDTPLHVEMWVTEVRSAWFVLRYSVRAKDDTRTLVTAQTTMVPFETAADRPRRLSPSEREFLALWADSEEDGVVTVGRHGTVEPASA